MLTRSEKTYLALTLGFLAAGSGIKAWRNSALEIGPVPDTATRARDSLRIADSAAHAGEGPEKGPADTSAPAAERVGTSIDSAASSGKRPDRCGKNPRPGKIDINRADAAGLMGITGIGARTAAAILDYRRSHGPFRAPEDLLNVKGIGRKKLEKIVPRIIL